MAPREPLQRGPACRTKRKGAKSFLRVRRTGRVEPARPAAERPKERGDQRDEAYGDRIHRASLALVMLSRTAARDKSGGIETTLNRCTSPFCRKKSSERTASRISRFRRLRRTALFSIFLGIEMRSGFRKGRPGSGAPLLKISQLFKRSGVCDLFGAVF